MSQPEDPKANEPSVDRKASPTAGRRRTMYGANVAIAVIAAIAIAIGFNWFVDWAYRQTPPGVKSWVRYDLTATRRYTLSPQTRKLLGELEQPREIYTLFRQSSIQRQRIRDLIDEYGRYSNRVEVTHLDPARDLAGRDQLYQAIQDRYQDATQPVQAALQRGLDVMDRIVSDSPAATSANEPAQTILADVLDPLSQALENEEFRGNDRQTVQGFVDYLQNQLDREQGLASVLQQVRQLLDRELPDYATAKNELLSRMIQLRSSILDQLIAEVDRMVQSNQPPMNVQENLLQAMQAMRDVREQLNQPIQELDAAELSRRYAEARGVLANNETIVALGASGVRVIPLQRMYREVPQQAVQQAGQQAAENQFIGEERLTGALVSLGLETPPMVVFVNTGGAQALGSQGQYADLAYRLEANDFTVTQWSATGRQTQFGQQIPAQAPPGAAEGQQTIWVVPPIAPPDPQNPMAAAQNNPAEKIASILRERIPQGDAALLMLNIDPGQQFGSANPLAEYLARWQVRPRLDQVVVHETQAPDQPEPQTTSQFLVDSWPDALPITQALGQSQGVFLQASPIEIGPEATAGESDQTAVYNGVTHAPLVRLTADRMWATSDFSSPQAMQQASYDEQTAADAFTVAVASQRIWEDGSPGRLVTVADPVWALDRVTTAGQSPFGVTRFPANGELFVNSVYWLAGLDQLIAASPRTQDIRRISDVSPAAYYGYYTLLVGGLPALVLVLGVGVYFVRRRS